MAGGFKIDPDYVDVAERIREFKAMYPEGSLQPLDHDNPYVIQELGSETLVVYRAAAYRTPDDLRPGIGVASEPYPGRTPYTKGSEIQNAETSAWGRAIVALGIPTKRVASHEEVRNRVAERETRQRAPEPPADEPDGNGHISRTEAKKLHDSLYAKGYETPWFLERLAAKGIGDGAHLTSIPTGELPRVLEAIGKMPDRTEEAAAEPEAETLSPEEREFLDATEGNGRPAETPPPSGKKGTVTAAQLTRLGALCSDLEGEGVGRDEWRLWMHENEHVASRTELTKAAASRVIDAFQKWFTDLQSGVVTPGERVA